MTEVTWVKSIFIVAGALIRRGTPLGVGVPENYYSPDTRATSLDLEPAASQVVTKCVPTVCVTLSVAFWYTATQEA